jgi:hypothetical protein
MTFPVGERRRRAMNRIGPVGGKSYVFFAAPDFLVTQELVDLKAHSWQEHIKDQMLSTTFDPDNRLVAASLEAEWKSRTASASVKPISSRSARRNESKFLP